MSKKIFWTDAAGLCLFTLLSSGMVVTVPSNVMEITGPRLKSNDRPIIGVLAQELSQTVGNIYPDYSSYIAASYVKYLESAGARVVPIWINKDKSYYKNLIQSLNGVLFPGGAVYFNVTGGYAEAGAILLRYAAQLNSEGDHFPVWGTCLGFELLAYLAAGQREPRSACSAENISLPLHFKPDYFSSQMFHDVPEEILKILSSQDVTANYHSFCVTEEMMISLGLNQNWHVLSTNFDINGIEFVSSFESRRMPFFGVQFHPEKNGYEFKPTKNIPHSPAAIQVMQYFTNFFVNQARKSLHRFRNVKEEQNALIYNYQPTYTQDHLSFEQCYFFK